MQWELLASVGLPKQSTWYKEPKHFKKKKKYVEDHVYTQILFINCNRREKEKSWAVEWRVHKHSLVRAGLWSAQRATLNGFLQVAVPEQVFLIPWTGIFFCSQAVNQMCHLLVHQLQMALLGWKFMDFRVRSGYCNHMNCLYPCKDQLPISL